MYVIVHKLVPDADIIASVVFRFATIPPVLGRILKIGSQI